jgi:hypothetical protein
MIVNNFSYDTLTDDYILKVNGKHVECLNLCLFTNWSFKWESSWHHNPCQITTDENSQILAVFHWCINYFPWRQIVFKRQKSFFNVKFSSVWDVQIRQSKSISIFLDLICESAVQFELKYGNVDRMFSMYRWYR